MCQDCGCSIAGTRHDHTHHHNHTHEHPHEHHNHDSNPELKNSKTVAVISKILDENDKEAMHNREHLETHGVYAINLMSSPGAGKTTLLEATIDAKAFKLGVIEGDLETNQDAKRIQDKGAVAYQITTGQACHLDAFMVHEGLHHMPLDELDIVFVENVGNLVCPASYDVGTHLNVVLLSTPEGHDKPAKYPVMFRAADLLLITKSELAPHFDFDMKHVIKEARRLNPKVDIIEVDSKTGKGIDKWVEYLKMKLSVR